CDRFEPIGAGGFPFAMERGSWIPAATVLPWRTGARYHAVAEEGVPLREIADVIGQGLNVPVVAKSPEEAPDHFGWLAAFIGLDCPASSAQTQERLGWSPKGPGLIPDLARHFEA
ncbi:MAG TPA: hypothetical protein VHT28_15210, partial [Silvibacterium sp.]|nr:hypothetical protein [Silvibacterium sp.]